MLTRPQMPQVHSGSPHDAGPEASQVVMAMLLRRRQSAADRIGDSSVYARGASNRDERHRSGDAESVPFTAMATLARAHKKISHQGETLNSQHD